MNHPLTAFEPAASVSRHRLTVSGQVQGVGFRPHAWRCAAALELSGWVLNHGDGVTIEVEGTRAQHFRTLLVDTLPPLARIDRLESVPVAPCAERGFSIRRSSLEGGEAMVPADVGICATCLGELFDPANRRYLHPFIACTDCGPRYSMARSLPYDRDTTSMADFALCRACAREYADSGSRRLHAEPIACHDCGPRLSHAPADIAAAIRARQIVALKGIGGYHLICDARDADTVARLRERKRRDDRPFALMMLNRQSLARCVRLDDRLALTLEGPQRPVMVVSRREDCALPDVLAPGLHTLGVMLPYTAVHYLLFRELCGSPEGTAWLQETCAEALVVTSANLSGEPMLVDDTQAREKLAGVADLIVSHDREITHGCDDSVLRATDSGHAMIRRGRGYAPGAYELLSRGPAVLALGAHLKNTVCVARGDRAFLSSHIGDLNSPSMHRMIDRRARELVDWLRVAPQAIACDLHPDYASTRLAERLALELDVPVLRVQHHHAHIAAVAAVAGHAGPVLGVALDGHGMGTDGGSWGGELLRVDGARCTRLGHLRPLALPGGDQAARSPWRLAAAFAASLGRHWDVPREDPQWVRAVAALGNSKACPRTTACGRYFDAAAAILGLCHHAQFEAQGPMLLEACCRDLQSDTALYRIDKGVLDLYGLLERLLDCGSVAAGSGLFHGTLLSALVAWISAAAEETGVDVVALGGGCFLNGVVASELPGRLRARGLRVLATERALTPGDGGLSVGQAAIARELLSRGAVQDSCDVRGEY